MVSSCILVNTASKTLAHSLICDPLINFHRLPSGVGEKAQQLKNTCYTCRGPGLAFQCPCGGSRESNILFCPQDTWILGAHIYFSLMIDDILDDSGASLLIELGSGLFCGIAFPPFPIWLWNGQLLSLSFSPMLTGDMHVCPEQKVRLWFLMNSFLRHLLLYL